MTVLSGILNARAAKGAANQQAQSEAAAQAEMRRQFDVTRQDQMPWLQAGGAALNQLQRVYGLNTADDGTGAGAPDYSGFYNSPDFQFARDMGQQGIDRSAAARGGLLSGNTLAAASKFNSGLATQNYGNYVNGLSGLAGIGQQTASGLGQLGGQYAQGVGGSLSRQGDARASGVLGQQAAYNGAISNGLQLAGMFGLFGGGGAGGAAAGAGRGVGASVGGLASLFGR